MSFNVDTNAIHGQSQSGFLNEFLIKNGTFNLQYNHHA